VPELTTNQKGGLAEAAIAKAAAALGVVVSRPMQDAPYDLILDLPNTLLRVQCKWAVRRGDVVVVHCVRCRRGPEGFIRRGYGSGEIDAIAAYCAEIDTCYLLPLSMSVNRTGVQLRLEPTRNNQQRLINWAKDYEFEATLTTPGPIAQLGERQHGMLEAVGSSPTGSINYHGQRALPV
jgi:PD-(D/E)XK nuclease superfamily protein